MAENQMATQIKSQIKASGLEDAIWNVIGFEIVDDDYDYHIYQILSPSEHYLFAQDGGGGQFYVLGDGRIFYLSSEAELIICGRSFKEFISITTSISHWQDALRFIPMQDPNEAASAWQRFEETFKDVYRGVDTKSNNFYETERQQIRAYFEAPYLEEPFLALYEVTRAASADVKVTFEGEDVPLLHNEKNYPPNYLIP